MPFSLSALLIFFDCFPNDTNEENSISSPAYLIWLASVVDSFVRNLSNKLNRLRGIVTGLVYFSEELKLVNISCKVKVIINNNKSGNVVCLFY